MRFTVQHAAHMASSVYEAEIKSNVHTCGPPPIRGYAPQRWVHEEGSGFTGAIYTAPGRSHIVLAFAGTNFRSGKDWYADAQIAANDVPIDQMERANRLYMAAKDGSGAREIIAVGHSLGGALAQFIASSYDLRAVTFNAPAMGAHMERWSSFVGMPGVNEGKLEDRIVNFRAMLDPVSVGLQILDVLRRTKNQLIGMPVIDNTWARHLGRVVHLGLGAGVHTIGPMLDYIDRQSWATSEPWSVKPKR